MYKDLLTFIVRSFQGQLLLPRTLLIPTMDTLSLHDHETETPAYSEFAVENLTPMTTLQNSRYDKTADVTLSHMVIEPGLFLFNEGPEPLYLPPDWIAYVHPEGQTYFYRGAGLRVVTEACLYRPEIMDKVSTWIRSIEDALRIKGVTPSATTELFLEPYKSLKSCGYYFVDHTTRSEFWIDQVSTEILQLQPVVSISHLKMALEALYWTHVEYFPMHSNCVSSDLVEELVSVFSHGQTDRMTSSTSTFPYDVDTCIKFIQLLNDAQGRDIDGPTTCFVARLWSNIVNSRFSNHFGQESPRLDRDQSILCNHITSDHWSFRLCTCLCFGLPEVQYARFNAIFVDHEVAVNDFQAMISDCMTDWKSSLSSSLPLLMSSILLSSLPAASKSIGLSSILMCGMSVVSSIVLSVRHDGLAKATAGRAYRHLTSIQSDTYGFRSSAVVFSFPRALCLWGLGLFMIQAVFLTIRLTHPIIAIALASFVLLVILGTGKVISAEDPWCCNQLLEEWYTTLKGYGKTLLPRTCTYTRPNHECIDHRNNQRSYDSD